MTDDMNKDREPSDEYELDELVYDEEGEDGDEGDEEGSSGKGGGKSPRRYRVMVEPFLDFADDPTLSPEENAERKLRLLAISPISILVPGASSFASENDLSRKLFMVDIGQANGEASARDIADPDFVDKRDALQRQRRTLFGLPHPSLVLSGGVALASSMVAAFSGFASSVIGKSSQDKSAKKSGSPESKKAKLLNFSAEKETAFGSSKDDMFGSGKDYNPDKPDAHLTEGSSVQNFGEMLEHVMVETVTQKIEVTRTALSFDSLASFFNYLSEKAKAPVMKVKIKEGGKAGSNVEGPTSPWQDLNPTR
ncbi:MAG: hypothetical protein PHX61_08340 [Alphaproteobacteria bacterium]|nr:hypothetical protein [Alphaproteobacteria bacterium]